MTLSRMPTPPATPLRCGPTLPLRTTTFAASCVLAAALLTACATMPPEEQTALDQARSEVQSLDAQPLATQTAGKPLQDAHDALTEAERAAKEHKPAADVIHLAYLARRRAEIGEAVVAETQANQQMADAHTRRDRLVLQQREQEAVSARQQADQAQAQAQVQRDAATQAQQEAETAKQQAQQSQQQADNAQQQLAALQAKQTERGMVLTLNNVLFDTNGDTLRPGASNRLDRVADFLKGSTQTRIRIEGYTDATGSDDYNQSLSERRADAVAHALMERGVDSNRIEAVGKGKSDAVATNATPEGRQQNRRVEIVFSSAQGQFTAG